MNIKLHAKLSAYSKIAKVSELPDPSNAGDGSILGVTNGEYVFFKDTDKSQIDALFNDGKETSQKSSMIDNLFNK